MGEYDTWLTHSEWYRGAHTAVLRFGKAWREGKREIDGETEDPIDVHVRGCLGECAYAKWACLYWPASTEPDRKTGDVAGWHVRTTKWATGYLRIKKRDPDDAYYVLVTGGPTHFTIRGYIYGRDGKQEPWWKEEKNGGMAYCVPQEALTRDDKLRHPCPNGKPAPR